MLKSINERLNNMESNIHTAGRGPGRGGRGAGRGDGQRGAGRGGAAGRGSGPGTQQAPTMYCFVHGTQRSHAGTDCHHMKNDTSYTQEMKNATAPCSINGFEGKK